MKTFKKISCFVLVIAMLLSLVASTIFTTSAATPLKHLVQTEAKWKYYIGGGTLYNTGCGIFSMRNAIGYLTGYDIGIDAPARWAHSIGAYNVTGGEGTYRLVLYPKITAKYGSKAGFKVINDSIWGNSSNATLKKHLANGGVAIGHVPGHFIALVDYSYTTGKYHVLDSAPSTRRGTTANRGDCWVTPSQLATGKLKLDWFCLLSATGTPADEQDNSKQLLANAIATAETKRYDQYTTAGVAALRAAYVSAVNVYNDSSSTNENYKAATTALENAMKVATSAIISKGKSYTMTNKWLSYDTAVDDGVKLTDGDKGNADGGAGKFSGAHTVNGPTEIVIDLGSVQNSNIYKIYMAAGQDGIAVPYGNELKMTVSVSNDGVTFTQVAYADNAVRTGNKAGDWQTVALTATADSVVSGRYVKFSVVSYASNGFVWLDEVEVINGEPVLSGNIYVNGFNKKIGAGDCYVFNSKFGAITSDTANVTYTANIIAKWVKANEYVVTYKEFGNASKPSITLASDEILIAAHNWETGVSDGTQVKGSAANTNTLNGVQVGDVVLLDGIDAYNGRIETTPFVVVQSATSEPPAPEEHKHNPGPVSCVDGQYCLTCGECLAEALGHDDGEWVLVEGGIAEELQCTKCGEVLDSREAENGDTSPEPDVSEPEVSEPEVSEPEVSEPEVSEPEVSEPEVSEPEVSEPEVSEPDVSEDDTMVPVGLYGDVNENEKIDMSDYVMLKRAYFGTYALDEVQTLLADMNRNGRIDMSDYVLLKRLYFGTYQLDDPIVYI